MAKEELAVTEDEELSEEDLELLKSEGIDPDMPEEEAETASEAADDGSGEPNAEAEAADKPKEQKPAQEGDRKDFVPLATFLEARNEAKQSRQLLDQIASRLAEQRAGKQEEAKPEGPSTPDPEQDPIGYMRHLEQQISSFQQSTQQEREQQQQQTQQTQQWQQFERYMVSEYDTAVRQEPAVAEAMEAARNAYTRQLQISGVPPEHIPVMLDRYQQNFAVAWAKGPRQNGVSLAEYIKQVGESIGWRPSTADTGKSGAEEQIERQKKAMAASKTLSKSGSGAKPDMDLKELANMSGEELEELMGKDPELFARLVG